jgi:hypothetical protein
MNEEFDMQGLRIPRWLITAVIVGAGILGLGFKLGAQVSQNDERITKLEYTVNGLDFRLCRIEKALQISPYQTCRSWEAP